jgi:Zn-dependent protease with chaperone function
MNVYQCMFDEDVTVIEVVKTDAEYAKAEAQFETGTYAFTVLGTDTKAMVIDGEWLKEDWVTDEHVQIVYAHEVGHIHNDSSNEIEADMTGLEIVGTLGTDSAFNLYCKEIQARYCNN